MLFDKKPFTLDSVIRSVLTILSIVALILMLSYLRDVLIPFALAMVIAYLIDPFVRVIHHKIRNRGLAVLIALIGLVLSVGLIFAYIIPAAASEVAYFGKLANDLVSNSQFAGRITQYLPQGIWQAIKDWVLSEQVQSFLRAENLFPAMETLSTNLLPGAWGLITGTASVLLWILGIAIVLLYVVFILLDFEKFRGLWKDLIPPSYREPVINFIGELNASLHKYFRAQAAVAGIVGILFAIGFEVVGLPMGVILGLFIGLLNMVPYLQLIGILPALLLALIHAIQTGVSIWGAIGLTLLVFVVVQTIQETILVPKIMKKTTGLSPAIILLSLSIWGKILGFLGFIIALPMTYLIYTYYRRYLRSISAIDEIPEIRDIEPHEFPPPKEKTTGKIKKLVDEKIKAIKKKS